MKKVEKSTNQYLKSLEKNNKVITQKGDYMPKHLRQKTVWNTKKSTKTIKKEIYNGRRNETIT